MSRTFRNIPTNQINRNPRRNNADDRCRSKAIPPDAWEDLQISAWNEVRKVRLSKVFKTLDKQDRRREKAFKQSTISHKVA